MATETTTALILAAVFTSEFSITSTTFSQCEPIEIQKLFAPDAAEGDRFGRSVALENDIAVVGSRRDNPDANPGAAFVYRFDGGTWLFEQQICNPDPKFGQNFGSFVAISGDVIVAGAPDDGENGSGAGAAFVFRYTRGTWVPEQKLLASDGESDDFFGQSLAIDDDVILVGTGEGEGAYVFRYEGSNWVEQQKLIGKKGDCGFGSAVSLDGMTALVGASFQPDPKHIQLSAYVYQFDGSSWVAVALLVPEASPGSSAGFSPGGVDILGNVVVLGHITDGENGDFCGAAFVFRFDGKEWNEEQKLLASECAFEDQFGRAVSIGSDLVVVGTFLAKEELGQSAAYVFRFDGTMWAEEATIRPLSGQPGDLFGSAVCVDDDLALIGALWDSEICVSCGAAYIFDLNPTSGGDLNCDGTVGAADLLILLGFWGPCGDCDNCLADLDDDCNVGASDLLILLVNWG